MEIPAFGCRTDVPVYAVGIDRTGQVVAAGGGGSSKTGVKNKIVRRDLLLLAILPHLLTATTCLQILFETDLKSKKVIERKEHEFDEEEDAAMAVALHPKVCHPTILCERT